MKKILYIAFCLLGLATLSCAKPDAEPYSHTECGLRSIYIKSTVPNNSTMIYGTIADETADPVVVEFKIIKPQWDLFDLEKMCVRATITYDEVIEPALGPLINLSDVENNPYIITVRNTNTGESKRYSLVPYKSVATK